MSTRALVFRVASLVAMVVLVAGLAACSSNGLHTDSSEIAVKEDSKSIRFSSFNIHYVSAGQKKLNWDNRKNAVIGALKDINADIIGFQEMETFAGGSFNAQNKQLDWVIENFPEYRAGAYGDAKIYPNTQPILYRHSRFEQLEQGFFFFSDTPEVIYSRTFNGSWPAFCSWTRLKDLHTGQEVTVFNVHFEYKSISNRSKSAKLVAERIAPLISENSAVVLLGDTNAPSFGGTMSTLKNIPLQLAAPVGSTFHHNRGWNLIPAIDHIFYSEQLLPSGGLSLLRRKYDGVWPTDHYPVVLDMDLVESKGGV